MVALPTPNLAITYYNPVPLPQQPTIIITKDGSASVATYSFC